MTTFPFKSMREWLSFIDKKDELLHITDEIDLRTDITGVHHFLSDEAKWGKNSPAVIFENIKGYPGWRLTTCSFLTPQRRAWIMGAPLERKEFASYVSPKLDQHVPPMEISDGPCKELKFFGDEVDLTKLPIPFSGDVSLEGTPSITAGISNKLDPELNWQNVAIRRYGLKGKRTLSEFISPVQQDFGIWGRYRRMKQPTPVAIVITSDPLTYMINLAKAPVGFCEYDLWGVFAGTPLEVVRCETSDLVVPANAEIIIEGELHHNIREMDGPCPEYCGYYTAIAEVGHVDVKCVTMRNDPIFYYLIMGMPPNEAICIQGLMTEMSVYRELVKLFPGVLDVSFDFHNIIGVVKVDKRIAKAWPGIARYIANAVKNIYSPKWMF
ncbi:MAG: UbiD family decarboxylase, partial [Thermodesulfobacteriota bacterium]|nr:UbiD family decarboxylase [Thermodesulfobacteriota bacterium]